jgi:paraquat-inducible protein A
MNEPPTASEREAQMEGTGADRFTCRLCGCVHRVVPLAPSERALCVQCGSILVKGARFGRDTALAFTVTALLLAIPAGLMPIATVGKLGSERIGSLLTSVTALWNADMRGLAFWVLVCGELAPLFLLGALAGVLVPARLGKSSRAVEPLNRVAHSVQHWAMPEVQVLAVLVAFTKLGSLVDVKIGPGLWCYAAMSVATLMAWRTFELDAPVPTTRPARPITASS